jgi:hypothetical protein
MPKFYRNVSIETEIGVNIRHDVLDKGDKAR